MGPQVASLTGGGHRVRLRPVDTRSVAPQPLEVVEVALRRTEDVHHDVDVVQEPPAGIALTFAPRRTDAEPLPKDPLDLLDDAADLAAGHRRADHEVIGDHDQLAHIEDGDVLGLFGGGGSGGDGGRFAAGPPAPPPPPPCPGQDPAPSPPPPRRGV